MFMITENEVIIKVITLYKNKQISVNYLTFV